MPGPYQPIPQTDGPASSSISNPLHRPTPPGSDADPEENAEYTRRLRVYHHAEFNRAPPAWWKRALLIVGLIVMAWFSIWLGGKAMGKPEVIYASRYSEEFKYRPAASPVITEYLPDGRIRLRGATVGGVGVHIDDTPLTAAQKKAKDKRKRDEARDKAREKMGLKKKGRKGVKPPKK